MKIEITNFIKLYNDKVGNAKRKWYINQNDLILMKNLLNSVNLIISKYKEIEKFLERVSIFSPSWEWSLMK